MKPNNLRPITFEEAIEHLANGKEVFVILLYDKEGTYMRYRDGFVQQAYLDDLIWSDCIISISACVLGKWFLPEG
jgi:hypothetical protein